MSKFIVRSRAPLRIGFAGGGTDVSPFCDTYGGFVVNSTIDRYAYSTIEMNQDDSIIFLSQDLNIQVTLDKKEKIEISDELEIHKAVYSYFIKNHNNNKNIPLKLSTFCDAPPGSGLGSSSTLVVAMVKSFVEFFNLAFDDYAVSDLAFQIERKDCALKGGKQDQYSAAFGGFNFMEFGPEKHINITPLKIKNWIINELEASLILYFTGLSRDSSIIISQQSDSVKINNKKSINALNLMKKEAISMKECIMTGDFNGIINSLKSGWESKKISATSVTNKLIEDIHFEAINAGALAGRLSGAGGGGFMLFYVPVNKRVNVINALKRFNGYSSNCHFTFHGAQSWRVYK